MRVTELEGREMVSKCGTPEIKMTELDWDVVQVVKHTMP
jgi:hypothetical protein